MMSQLRLIVCSLFVVFVAGYAVAQTPERQQQRATSATTVALDVSPPNGGDAVEAEPAARSKEKKDQSAEPGRALPNSDRLRVRIGFMAAWVHDPANAPLGFEQQGRVGFVTIGLSGKLTDKVKYLAEINPVNETSPLAACGESGYFFPNFLQGAGPTVPCDPNGRMRVDDYRYIALDPVRQQGMIRQAYLEYVGNVFGARFGRFILPVGISWEETGAFTAKDTPHIARINTEANFGVGVSVRHSERARLDLAAVLGDGNRFRDYDYFYLLDGSLDTNSALTGVVSGSVRPIKQMEVRGAYKFGYTGSKVERLPNFFASKRNDMATVMSVRYTPARHVSVFGEYARYTWGLTKTSAEMLGLNPDPVNKAGYFVGGEASYPFGRFKIGGSVVREELSRDDSLVKYMAEVGLYHVTLGKKERATIYRLWLDTPGGVRVGVFYNDYSNPFPQLSGIVAVEGPAAYQNASGDSKYGFAVQFRLQ